MGMPVHLYELEDEYVGSSDMEGSPPDSLDWNGRMFRKSMAILKGDANVQPKVLVADRRCDWIGMGLAEKLAREGCRVRLAVNGMHAEKNRQPYLRYDWVGILATPSLCPWATHRK